MRLAACWALWAAACFAQEWELGGAAGYGIYRNGSITAPAGSATAGIRNRFAVGAVLTENMYEHLSGELRYTYHDGDPFLQAAGVKANVQGQSHAFHYDLLFHSRPHRAKLRPFVAVGAGVKQYNVSGPGNPSQPLASIGLLTSTNQFKPLISLGGGVKYRAGEHLLLRFDFRDYITPFPKAIITPAPGATAGGFFHQFTPLAGISYAF